MIKAELHPQQRERLATLRRYEILDTPRESEFDEIVELASEACGTPIAVVNIIDECRQWFKAEVGLGTRETPLATSIFSHIILKSDFVEIKDTLKDPRTADNELCLGRGGLRFYAGALLKASNGMPLGTLCVLDTKPRVLNELQKRTLAVLAGCVMRELELRLALRNQEVLRDEMDHRVKNSLQAVSSYVRLYQAKLRKNEDPAIVLDAVARRIEAVSALHEALHNSNDERQVRLDKFLQRIIGYIKTSAPTNVAIKLALSEVEVRADMAGAIGAIVSEFVANSIKHAFPDGRQGQIRIRLALAPGQIEISCSDNGVGTSEVEMPVIQSRSDGLGTRIVASAAAQIGAKLSRKSNREGYWLEMTIPMTMARQEAFSS